MSRSQFLVIALVLLSLLFSQLFYLQLDGIETVSFHLQLTLFTHLVAEFLFVAGLLAILVNGSIALRLLAYLASILFILTYILQYVSLILSNEAVEKPLTIIWN